MDSRATMPPVGRRERNKQRVRERLYSAAVELFVEKGYENTSINEIAERADVARGTFFNYFQRKEDIITAWGERRRAALVTSLEEYGAFTPSSVARLQQCMAILVRINQEEPDLTPAMLTAWVKAGRPILEEPYVAEVFARIVESGMGRGELTPAMSPIGVGNVLRDVYLGALYRWANQPSHASDSSLADELQQILRLVLEGMTPASPPR
ncbi:TetR/AcrR family transcriptional regulator [Streptomyces sp. NPDC012751]|uniref:TetR/AcrR family transcriptional regulator n=1 Tax=Streptomyces sp. NPDC012751 TaxID=3364846 RepID=UPI0036B95109